MSGVDEFGDLLQGVLTQVEGCARYALRGELDMVVADQLLGRLREIYDERSALLELDLADVTFMDSSGARTLVLASREAERRGGALLLVRPSPPVVRVIRLCGLEEALVMHGEATWEDLQS